MRAARSTLVPLDVHPLDVHPVAALMGLLLPTWCPGCGSPDQRVCAGCRSELAAGPRRVVLPALRSGPAVWICTEHAGVPARLVVAWKEHGRHDLVRVLAPALARSIRAAAREYAGDLLLVPVPSTAAARRRRGEDGVRRLALAAAAQLRRAPGTAGVRVTCVLRHRRRVADQSGLGAAERRRNLAGALAVPGRSAPAVAGRQCIVLDDIVTTGATVAEAAGALVACGARVVAVAAISATPGPDRLFGARRRV